MGEQEARKGKYWLKSESEPMPEAKQRAHQRVQGKTLLTAPL